MRLFLITTLVLAFGCTKPADEDKTKLFGKAKCETDEDCAEGFICEDKACSAGARSPEEIAKAKQAALEKRQAEEARKTATKPGEGRLVVRICPGYKNTPESIGTIVATHQETKEKHFIDLALRVSDGGWESEFTFYSLPLGKYDVTASYGIQVRGQPDGVHKLKCHEEAKKGCRDEVVREFEVLLPKDTPPPAKYPDGRHQMKDCDWSAE